MAVFTVLGAAAALLPAIALGSAVNPDYPQPGNGLPAGTCVMLCTAPPSSNVLPDQGLPGCLFFCDDRSGWTIPLG
ncbi:hypothetical protein GPX89_15110 [Nocardia sp. ET3-3]|uniref:Secreted protein n=1 Tax=Nocardia terrae TaxID=2675851 RepID=A0A7K1UWA5_9NOCA|nr:hypothetical protein [Nocardia terrae]MVU78572.1 hypothetical protein [Nocardia terrae]